MDEWTAPRDDLIWLACFIEAESNFGMYAAKTRWRKAPTKRMYLELTNTDRLIMDYLEDLLGRKACLKTRKKEWGDNPERSKPCWRITIMNRRAVVILRAVLPYMKGEKVEKAKVALAEYEERVSR